MFIATFNVNSIRRRLPVILAWIDEHKPDVMCMQETKVTDELFPADAFREAGYNVAFRGMKSYNGVATISRSAPEKVQHGFFDGPDNEDFRMLHTTIDGIHIVNTYVPQGYQVTSEKYQYKLIWFRRIRRYFEEHFTPDMPLIWTGDMNVAPEPIDVYHPDRRVNDVNFHIDARTEYKRVASWGFTDVFRLHHPDRVQYTYWDYFRNSFKNNFGWRIDHILATGPVAAVCKEADVDMEPRKAQDASDHTIMWARF